MFVAPNQRTAKLAEMQQVIGNAMCVSVAMNKSMLLEDSKPTMAELELAAKIHRKKPKSYTIYVAIEKANWDDAMEWIADQKAYVYPLTLQGFAFRNRSRADRETAMMFKLLFG